MAVDKKLLDRLTILYVEDDDNIRTELSGLLSNFFKKIYTASNGEEGVEVFIKNKDNIDLILSDINMPKLTGIEMMKKIRGFDTVIPVIFATAYSDNNFLSDAIKIKVYDYIIKPIDIRKLLNTINDLASILYQEYLISQKTKEAQKYKEVIETNNIVLKLSEDGNIIDANQLFLDIGNYQIEDIVNRDIKELGSMDNASRKSFDDMTKNLTNPSGWNGQLKFKSQDGEVFICECNNIPVLDINANIESILSIQKDITEEINQKREVQKTMIKEKSRIIQESKKSLIDAQNEIISFRNRNRDLEKLLKQALDDKNKVLTSTETIRTDYKRMQVDLALCHKN